MRQEEAFLRACGDIWYDVNKEILGKDDPVSDALDGLAGFNPQSILEIGCSTGWRLKKLHAKYDCRCCGLEPSAKALETDEWPIMRGTAEKLPWDDAFFDTIIYGYCLAYVDPDNYFRILAECDRVLCDSGIVVIHDGYSARPVRLNYVEMDLKKDGEERTETIWQYLHDFKKLWLAHPHYREVGEMLSEVKAESVVVLQKRKEGAFTTITPDIPRPKTLEVDYEA